MHPRVFFNLFVYSHVILSTILLKQNIEEVPKGVSKDTSFTGKLTYNTDFLKSLFSWGVWCGPRTSRDFALVSLDRRNKTLARSNNLSRLVSKSTYNILLILKDSCF